MNELTRRDGRLDARQQRTLAKIERHPASGNIEWRQVISLLAAVGEVVQRRDGKYLVRVGGEREVLKPPRGRDVDAAMVVDLRRMLAETQTNSRAEDTVPPGQDVVVAIDYHRARVFDIARPARDGQDLEAPDPWLLNRHLQHKYYFEHGHYDLDSGDTDKMFEAIYADLRSCARVLLAGHGTGKANAAAVFRSWWNKHHQGDIDKIVGTAIVDVDDITDKQILRWGEEYFGADHPERDYGDSRRGARHGWGLDPRTEQDHRQIPSGS